MKSRVFASALYYLPMYLVDDRPPNPSGECSLFVRQVELVEKTAGLRVRIRPDILVFPDAEAMVAALTAHGMTELPPEADGDLLYIPEELRDRSVRAERASGRINLPDLVTST